MAGSGPVDPGSNPGPATISYGLFLNSVSPNCVTVRCGSCYVRLGYCSVTVVLGFVVVGWVFVSVEDVGDGVVLNLIGMMCSGRRRVAEDLLCRALRFLSHGGWPKSWGKYPRLSLRALMILSGS